MGAIINSAYNSEPIYNADKLHLSTLGITQAQFASLSGIGLSTIKKLECDMMNPKPKMLLKIADALGVSINIFTDFDIVTVSDVMSLLTKMDEQIEMDFHAKYDEDGNPIPDSIKISFKHPSLNRKLADYVKVKDLQNKLDDDQQKYTAPADQETLERMNTELEMTRLTICRAPVVIAKKFNDGHCTIRINGTPVPLQRYGQFAPTVRYPFLRLFIGSKFLMFFPFISRRYDSLRTRARLASA